MTEPKQSCGVCSEVLGDLWNVTCDGPCGRTFHTPCTELSMTHLNAWTAKVGLQWFCRTCRLDFDTGVRHRESVLQATIREMFAEVQRTMRDLVLRVDAMDKRVEQQGEPDASAQQIVLTDEKCLECGEDFAAERCVSTESEQTLQSAQKELIVASSYDKPVTCTNREESAKHSVLDKPEPQLSSKIWAQVFWHLNFTDLCQIRLVCSEWKKIVDTDQSLMEKFSLNFPSNITVDRDFEAISMMPASGITFKECTIVAVGSWWTPKITENLDRLQLKTCKISLINLLEMLRCVPNLRILILHCGSTLTYNSAVEKFSDVRLEKLQTLEIDSVKQDEVLKVLGKMFPRLKDFVLHSGYDACHRAVHGMMSSTKSLEELHLPLSSRVLSDLAAGVKDQLKRVSLSLPSNDDIKLNEQLIHFSRTHSLLESFHFSVLGGIKTYVEKIDTYENKEEYQLDNKTLTEVFQNFPKLKHLSMGFLHRCNTARMMWRLVERSAEVNMQPISHLTKLEYLAFNGVEAWKSKHQGISFHGAKNPNLTELHLSHVAPPSYRNQFALQEYIENAPNLRVITLESCLLSRWSDLFTPIQLREFRRLKLTSVCTNKYGHEDGLLEYFDQLHSLELTACEMSEDFLLTLFRLSPRVEELLLSRMEHASDAVVLLLSEKMKKLRKLTLDQCPITDAAVVHIIEHAKNLKQLTIRSCSALTLEVTSQLESVKNLVLTIE